MEIIAIVASDAYMDFLDGHRVIKPEMLETIDFEYVFVMSDVSYENIVQVAMNNYGVPRRKLISYKVLQIPGVKLEDYFKLYESNISIISNNCWGGMAYNTLGMECLSPFKNLFIEDLDYLKIISDISKYLNNEPILDRYEVEKHSNINYPVLRIDDVEIHCNHTTDANRAIGDWTRLKEKVNHNNLFFEMYTTNQDIAEKFVNIIKEYRGICFVPWKTKSDKMMQLILAPKQKEFYEAVNVNASLNAYGLKYCLVELLLGEQKIRY